MREFAEAEVVVPDGPFAGRRFRTDRQPFGRLWFDAIDSGRWRRAVATGPQQSGKTLTCFSIPLMYHLFEIGETVICGVPNLEMVKDKWLEDILPAIQASRYKELLPTSGEGSRGGNVESRVQFTNGATLRFMTGGGGDKARAGFTSRVLVVTETDGMDESGGNSREADKITQLEGRTRAYGDRARIYMECTVSVEEGRTWQEYSKGTASRIALRCPHCRAWVTPEREHLIGWQDAADELEAGSRTRLVCPANGCEWSEDDRREANADAILVHAGQEVTPEGTITGQLPRSETLGFRWTAANNLLVSQAVIGKEEWKASRAENESNAERAMRQFWWALPSTPEAIDLTSLDAHLIVKRVGPDDRGRCPHETRRITVAVDLGKWLCHWVAIAWREHATPHVVDYGRLEVPSNDMAIENALLVTLRQFRDSICAEGWEFEGQRLKPEIAFIDSGWRPEVAYAFCEESGQKFLPTKGLGVSQDTERAYREVKQTGATVVSIGQGYHVARLDGRRTFLVEVNADSWKEWVHQRLQTPLGQPGAMTLFKPSQPSEHLSFVKHLLSEKKEQAFVAGKGLVTKWKAIHRNNHWLDATYLACCAAHGVGERLIEVAPPAPPPPPAAPAPPKERHDWMPDRPSNWMNR